MGTLFSDLTGQRAPSSPLKIPATAAARPLRVGWLLAAQNVQSASVRYRAFHMARVLAQSGVESAYFTDAEKISAEIRDLDAVVVVKRIDAALLRVAAAAQRFGKAMFFDLCDDLLSDRYNKNADGLNGLMFAALAPQLTAVTVPSAAMAERVRHTAARLRVGALPVHVIPDIAETRALFHLTETFVDGKSTPAGPRIKLHRNSGRKQVLWFGNFGAKHSNFGIFSLLPALPALEAVNEDIPLELVVISNSQPLFKALVAGCGFATRYIPWTAHAVYDALEQADLALLTSGTDDFCTVKSSNRPLQALAAGVPVVTEGGPALTEFAEIALTGNYERDLRACLEADPATRYRDYVAPAAPLLARYSPQALAGLWRTLIERAAASPPRRPSKPDPLPPPRPQRIMVVVEEGADPLRLRHILRHARKLGLDREVAMSVAMASELELREEILRARLIPRVLPSADNLSPSLMSDVDILVTVGTEGALSAALRPGAARSAIPVVTDATPMDRAAVTPPPPAVKPVKTKPATPGPNPEAPNADGSADWIFVVHPKSKGWILDGLSREIGSRQLKSWTVAYSTLRLPQAKTYFFAHFSLFRAALRSCPDVMSRAQRLVWYTHPRNETPEGVAELLEDFQQATKVIFTCTSNRDLWIARGLDPARAEVVLGGADPALFTGHARGGGAVGLSSSFYERKTPDLLRALVRLMPHRRFHLVGRNWEQYALFSDLLAAPNFRYDTLPYGAYPEIYRGFDVFLSMSRLEGGPIPLLEAMMENAVPVASRTGFAPDLIQHGENGYLFDAEAPAEAIAALIEAAYANRADIRATVKGYDWDTFARQIVALTQ